MNAGAQYEDLEIYRYCEVCHRPMGKMTENEWDARDDLCDECIEDDKEYITWP